jgi:hypothetical protein
MQVLGVLRRRAVRNLCAAEALGHQGLIGRAVGCQREHVRLVELASGPSSVAKVDIAVLVDGSESGADVLLARSSVATTDLRNDSLAAVGAEPGSKRSERVGDVVSDALGVCAAVVGVKVAVDVEDELAGGAIRVLDCQKCRAAVLDKGSGGSIVSTRKKEVLRGGTGLADSSDGSLNGSSPSSHGKVMGLVHQSKRDVLLRLVLRGNLRPNISELSVGGSTLTDDSAIPAGVVVQINDTKGTGSEAALNQLVVGSKDSGIKCTAKRVLGEVLPSDRQAVGIELIGGGEVLHLGDAVGAGVYVSSGAGSVGGAAKVESSNVDSSVLGASGGRRALNGGCGSYRLS